MTRVVLGGASVRAEQNGLRSKKIYLLKRDRVMRGRFSDRQKITELDCQEEMGIWKRRQQGRRTLRNALTK